MTGGGGGGGGKKWQKISERVLTRTLKELPKGEK